MRLLDDAATIGLTADRWDVLVVAIGIVLFSLGVMLAVKL